MDARAVTMLEPDGLSHKNVEPVLKKTCLGLLPSVFAADSKSEAWAGLLGICSPFKSAQLMIWDLMVTMMIETWSESLLLQDGREIAGRVWSFNAGVKKSNICTRLPPPFTKSLFLSATWWMSKWMRWALYVEFYIETYQVVFFTPSPPTTTHSRHPYVYEIVRKASWEGWQEMINSAPCVSQSLTPLYLHSAFFLFLSVEGCLVQRFLRVTCLNWFALMSSGVHKNCTDVFPSSD